jgi:hypothetical protein
MCLNRLFSIKELEALDEKQLAILNDAIRFEILRSKEVSKILRKKLKPLYDGWVAKRRPKRRRGARPTGGRARARKSA